MRNIGFDPSKIADPVLAAEWAAWELTAAKALEKTVQAWETWKEKSEKGKTSEKPEKSGKGKAFEKPQLFNNNVWSALKLWLREHAYNGKCAYCETKLTRDPGHAEHYRPKGRVQYDEQKVGSLKVAETIDGAGKSCPHPGYFWLAYHWKNLAPSCFMCNAGEGKGDRFPAKKHLLVKKLKGAAAVPAKASAPLPATTRKKPEPKGAGSAAGRILTGGGYISGLWPGYYYPGPDELNAEERPIILGPYEGTDPSNHLVFSSNGLEAHKTRRGRETIRILGLDHDDLRQERQKVQDDAINRFSGAFGLAKGTPVDRFNAACSQVKDFVSPGSAYSAAVRDALEELFKGLTGYIPGCLG
jgi:hypothetical protein